MSSTERLRRSDRRRSNALCFADRLPGDHRTGRVLQPDRIRSARGSGRHRVLRTPMERTAVDQGRLWLREGHRGPEATGVHAAAVRLTGAGPPQAAHLLADAFAGAHSTRGDLAVVRV